MKILLVIATLNPSYGGPAEGVKQIALAAILLGHEIEIAVTDSPSSPWLIDFGVKVHPLGPSFLTYSYTPRLVPWLHKHATGFDAVIIHGLWQYVGYAARNTLLEMNVPYFVFTHGQLGTWFKKAHPFKHIKKWIYWKLVQHRILRDAKAVFFTSEEEKLQSRQSFKPYNIVESVIGYGTIVPVGDPDHQRELFHTQFPGLRDKKLFVFVGRISKQKACDMLIQAFSEVAKDDSSLHLVIAGPDQVGWKQELVVLSKKLAIEHQITWTGMLTGDLKWGAFNVADCFVLPSHHESFGVVVAEALACGIPVLISNKVNIWHEVHNSGAGFVANDDLSGTVEMLKKWAALSHSEKNILRRNTLDCFNKNFNIKSSVVKIIRVIESFLDNP